MIAVFNILEKDRQRKRRIPCSPLQWQLEQEAMFLNCMREEKFPKDKEGEILEQIAWGDSQIFITGEFLKQICKVCPVMTEWTSIQFLSSVLLCT